MDVALLVCRLVLAAVFVTAAVAKLLDRPGTRRSAEQLGVPAALAPAVAFALPLLEAAVAVALVPVATAWAASLVAVALLLAFTGAVANVLARGEEAECHCFGRVSAEPVGPRTLVRNAVLLALAGFVAVAGFDGAGTSATAWIGELSALDAVLVSAVALLAVAVAFNGAFLVQLLRQNGRLWAELDALGSSAGQAGPPAVSIGEPAPPLAALDLAGQPVDLGDLLDRLPAPATRLMLVFASADCPACDPLLPEVGRRQRDEDAELQLALIALGSHDDVAAKCSEHGIESALVIEDVEAPRPYGINGFPGAVGSTGWNRGEAARGTARTLFSATPNWFTISRRTASLTVSIIRARPSRTSHGVRIRTRPAASCHSGLRHGERS